MKCHSFARQSSVSVGDTKEQSKRKLCGPVCKQATKKRRTCACRLDETCLQCGFHALQPFGKGDSYAKKFKDKKLVKCSNGRARNGEDKKGLAYEQALMIWRARTFEMRAMQQRLVLGHWRTELNEKAAADHFENEIGVYPTYNWNINATGEAGVYPTGNASESHNRKLKSPEAKLTRNASIATFLVWNSTLR